MAPLERDRELAAIEGAARNAALGNGSVVLIEGPAGIGKSAILDEARRRTAGDMRSLFARGGLLERDFTFGVVRQLLEIAARDRDVPAAAHSILAEPASHETEGSFAVLHGLFWTVLDVAGDAPLLLAVEDLHWADTPSLRFLAYLARRIEELPVLLLATVRSGEPDVDEDLLDAVRQAPATVLTPAPLSAEAAVKALLAERLGDAEAPFVAAVQTATGGNPLLVRELAGALEDEGVEPVAARADAVRAVGPRAVRRTVAPRLGTAQRRRRRDGPRGRDPRRRCHGRRGGPLRGTGRRSRRQRHRPARTGGDPARRAAAGVRAPAGRRRGSPGARTRGARASARPRGATAARERGAGRAGRRPPAARAGGRGALGRRRADAGCARPHSGREPPRSARPSCAARSMSRRPARSEPTCCSSSVLRKL